MSELSHLDAAGRAHMVDVSAKRVQLRIARARGIISMQPATAALVREKQLQKGDVLAVAQVAGIQAAKRTAELIPLCHPLTLERIAVELRVLAAGVEADSEVAGTGRTGVEMEALVAVAAALLTVYDMCKSADKDMTIGELRLLEKVKRDV